MRILHDVSLKLHSTMRLGGNASFLANIHSNEELKEALRWAEKQQVPVIMIGGGSNIIWKDEGFNGLVLVNKIDGFETKRDGQYTLVTIGAGENWDNCVEHTVARGLTGIEALSLIPGTAGATPVQNVGAYGQEIADTLVDLKAYDLKTKKFVTIAKKDCAFGYRTSRFKTNDRGRFFIVSLTLRLHHGRLQPPYYRALDDFLHKHGLHNASPQIVRDAVMVIRNSKLPDPAEVANNGSFFGNPIIANQKAEKLLKIYPEMPQWSVGDDKTKLPAGWLVEHAGFKDYHDRETGMCTWAKQSLVLVNERAQKTEQLLTFRKQILDGVKAKFGITLEQEPELLP